MTVSKNTIPVIAIDGPAGSGKSTIAAMLARTLGFNILISGALYRIIGNTFYQRNMQESDTTAIQDLVANLEVRFVLTPTDLRVVCDGEDVTDDIVRSAYSTAASNVGTMPAIRTALLGLQRSYRCPPGLVADGRDMASIVFPAANIKVFLTASVNIRANRRYQQLNNSGIDANLDDLIVEIKTRDKQDLQRMVAPLKEMPDAIKLDTSNMTVQEAVEFLTETVNRNNIS